MYTTHATQTQTTQTNIHTQTKHIKQQTNRSPPQKKDILTNTHYIFINQWNTIKTHIKNTNKTQQQQQKAIKHKQ